MAAFGMSELERSVRRFRKGLLDRDAEARMAIRRSFQVAIAGLQADLTAATNRIAELRETSPVPTWRLLQEQRIRQLLARAEIEFQQFSDRVDLELVRAQRDAINKAQADARQLIVDGFGPGPAGVGLPIHLLPVEALKQLTATLQPDAPVRRLLDELAGDASQAVQDELVRGMAAGLSPYAIGRTITKQLGAASSVRAQRIVRTELMRSYRESMRATLEENKHLINGWIWYSALNARTCPVCLALHGRRFDVETKMATHPNCRCVLMPVTKSWKDLGYDIPDTRQSVQSGPDAFATWSADQQRRVLGPAAFRAYQAGEVQLSDFVGNTRSEVWGSGRRRLSLLTARTKATSRIVVSAKPIKRTVKDDIDAIRNMGVQVNIKVEKHPQFAHAARLAAEGFENLRSAGAPLPPLVEFYSNPKDKRSFAYFSSSYQRISFNLAAKWSDMAKTAADQKKYGFWSSDDEFAAVYHEVGHYAHFRSLDEQGRGESYENKNWFGPTPSDDLVSRYATTNRNEFVAEVYAGTMSGIEYSSAVMAFYNRANGPPLPKPNQKRKAS